MSFFLDEYKMKEVEEVKYMRGEEDRVNARNQENLQAVFSLALTRGQSLSGPRCHAALQQEKVDLAHIHDTTGLCTEFKAEKSSAQHRAKQHKEVPGSSTNKINIHTSESQQEFFRMLDEKIEKVRED
ncbi:hypothetical protein DNTS_003813 [Danionella cerebrum]|uniref:Uncharacterized protein n=1 Tax=Danionella cerebrum TaxID=2873325 RepID=A0A553RNY7_9TELE|nr:hypothetical protein DNTS_003813 [Danionella translucida]